METNSLLEIIYLDNYHKLQIGFGLKVHGS